MHQILKKNKIIILGIICLSFLIIFLVSNKIVEKKYSDALVLTENKIYLNADVSVHNKKVNDYILIFGIFSTVRSEERRVG